MGNTEAVLLRGASKRFVGRIGCRFGRDYRDMDMARYSFPEIAR